ncbi:MAG: hypothetical protein JSV88_19085 [Candidatus Aminicenantes bacterium]|nr:MAG: hypothetical protein JSV88_19085 [Candidatus Aminicenantes bacterium]
MGKKKDVIVFVIILAALFVSVSFGETKKPLKEEVLYDYLPSINELHNQAIFYRVTSDWKDKIKIKSQDYNSLGPAKRALAVGKTIADIGFLVLIEGEDKKVPKNILDEAMKAIKSLEPPEEVNKEIKKFQSGVRTGALKGKKLRDSLEELIRDSMKMLEKEQKNRDIASLAFLSSFCRLMYMSSSTIAQKENPPRQQLDMFRYSGVIDYFVDYFTHKAEDSFKKDIIVEKLISALKKIKPILQKAPGKFVKNDISTIEKVLEPLFK